MRVTNRMMSQNLVRNLGQNTEALNRVQQQLSSGKRVTRPGDDPVAAALGVRVRDDRAASAQFQRNIDQAQVWLNATDGALGDVGDALQRIRELTVQASSDSYSSLDRAAAGTEVTQLHDQLLATFNATMGGQHLFGGTTTTITPFTKDGAGNAVYNGDTAVMSREVSPGATVAVSVPGSTFMTLLGHVEALKAKLTGPSTGPQIATSLADLDVDLDVVLTQRAEVGAKVNRLDYTRNRLLDTDVELGRLQAANEDVDYAEAMVRFTTQQTVYQAALAVGGRIAPTSLMDFLR